MANIYLIQLTGILLILAGWVALMASAYTLGTPLSRDEKERLGRGWTSKGSVHRLPINLQTIASIAFLVGGFGILGWTKFNLCAFLAYWLPSLPEAIKLLLACR